ncbi:GNAT family N-acetyltransferase [Rhizobium sp. DKSPLA3]|uniref:GNAT family N-acetyltransferase n=1 Tax=Rhizobium quercicola TaxID=2901226 RepID=A0A9X1NTD6_9HYPH|nr:GNAT family N-acetyltransferase [Rhizobium quercicola]MCD7110807.1 GNAT family N-acetyltransferase [Rhizobium quercicola]
MIIAETERLRIRNWQDPDRDLFFEINSDAEVMTFFPFRRDRAAADALFDRNRDAIADTGYGFFALALKETDEPIGFCGLAVADLVPILPAGTIEIGWRLARRHWSKGYVTEAASALLAFGFETRGLAEIVSFAVADNDRSIAVMERIGLARDIEGDFEHPRVPDTHPHLKRHVLYRLKRPQ